MGLISEKNSFRAAISSVSSIEIRSAPISSSLWSRDASKSFEISFDLRGGRTACEGTSTDAASNIILIACIFFSGMENLCARQSLGVRLSMDLGHEDEYQEKARRHH